MRVPLRAVFGLCVLAFLSSTGTAATVITQNPILFVTQVPQPADFTTIGSVFGNHQGDMQSAPRGGDLYIRYPDGTLKNLTAAAGFGNSGQQGANSIAVRDPSPHWSGTKAVFSMVVGAPTQQFQVATFYWQMYEITGLGQGQTPVITKVPNQPANFNNVSPIYGTDERIIFTSDRPRDGSPHLYPQLDEYEEAPVVSGLWSLDPATGNLFIMSHNPSGNFNPTIDSAGRVIYTRWDHLQRDQQADADAQDGNTYGTFNFSSEAANAAILPGAEVFPEPRSARTDLLAGTNLVGNSFNQFFPWQITEDGTDEETLNHVGRHELYGFFTQSFTDDGALTEFDGPLPGAANQVTSESFLQIREDPLNPGLFYATEAPEFATHAGGRILTITGQRGLNGDLMKVKSITDPSTGSFTAEGASSPPENSGHYRNPVPLSDGQLIAMHTSETRADKDIGTGSSPQSRYDYRLKLMVTSNGNAYMTAGAALTGGIVKSVTWWDPDVLLSYSGPLWEMGPVELVARAKPARLTFPLPTPEQNVLAEEGVDEAGLRSFLRTKNLAILVSRNVTTRDHADRQQPYNLRVEGTTTQTIGLNGAKIYDIAHQQFFQADQVRGLGVFKTGDTPRDGRRVLAQVMHDPAAVNPFNSSGPSGSVQIASDGSTAALVPARRAMTWQITDGNGTPVVRERYWLTFQPGEIRSCTSCHGLNTRDQANNPTPLNEPLALHKLLQFYKSGGANGLGPNGSTPGDADSDGFPDALETAYGSSPTDPSSTPFGGAPAGAIQTLKLSRFDVKLDFSKHAHDQVTLGGTLNVPAGFAPLQSEIFIFSGGVAQHFLLDAKGSARSATASCKLNLKIQKGKVAAQTAKFTAMLHKGDFAAGFAAENLTGAADVKNQPRTVQVFLLFNKTVYQLGAPLLYSARKAKTGTGKLKAP